MPKKTLTAKILEFIKDNPGVGVKDIATMMNISPNLARRIVYSLKNSGYVEKTGMGYIVTTKGEWLLRKLLPSVDSSFEEAPTVIQASMKEERKTKHAEERVEEKNEHLEIEAKRDKIELKTYEDLDNLKEKLFSLEKRLEEALSIIEETRKQIEELKRVLNEKIKEKKIKEDKSKEKPTKLPMPIMSIEEARSVLGPYFNTLVLNGRIEIIGSLAVDSSYYKEFRKKFPLSIKDAEKLPPMEQKLLEEMKRDARVIIHGGKYYKLIS